MYLDELYAYKNQLMKDLLTNPKITGLLDDIQIHDHPEVFAYKQVFPYEFIPETVDYGHTFICFDVDVLSSDNKTFLNPALYVWVFTHKSKLRVPTGGVRTDLLASEIVKTIGGSHNYGLGDLSLYSVKRFAPATDYNGKVLTFRMSEYNMLSPNRKPVPTNRRLG